MRTSPAFRHWSIVCTACRQDCCECAHELVDIRADTEQKLECTLHHHQFSMDRYVCRVSIGAPKLHDCLEWHSVLIVRTEKRIEQREIETYLRVGCDVQGFKERELFGVP